MVKETNSSMEQDLGEEIGEQILDAFTQENLHPTKIIVEVISRVYGHEVDLHKLIELIETSELKGGTKKNDKS